MRVLPESERPNDAAKIQMLSNMIYKDRDFRDRWSVAVLAKPLNTSADDTFQRIKARTANNTADFFTKPLPPAAFLAFRKIIMNVPDEFD